MTGETPGEMPGRTPAPAGSTTESAAAALVSQIAGSVLRPGEPGWADEIRAFNASATHRPELVVAVAGVADIQIAVRYAAANGLLVGVQATGHGANVAQDGGLLISTRHLDAVSIDPDRRTATVQAGARWRQVIDAAARYGLAPPSGSTSGVSAVGYTVGGGLPVLGRLFGFAADHVRSLEVVTADGELRHSTADEEPDLFWGLRGGGCNLGIVTEMTIDLFPVATFYGGAIFYPAEHIPAVLHAWRRWCVDLPEAVGTSIAILRLPDAPDVPPPLRGQTVAHLRYCHVGDPAAAAELLSPMRTVAPALADTVTDRPYTEIDAVHTDPHQPVPFCQAGLTLRDLTADTIDAVLVVAGAQAPVPVLLCEIRLLGGALARPPSTPNAVGGRDAAYHLSVIAVRTPDAATAAPAVAAVLAAAQPWSSGRTLLNLHGVPADAADRARAWDPATYRRLADLRTQYDPHQVFRYGHLINREC
jgi:FAD/FMN-containing dehydrogenase